MPISEKFMQIPPRHRRALELLLKEKKKCISGFGEIGTGALRDEDEPFTLEQIVGPLEERGLIEDLTWTDLGDAGKYFSRITPLGEFCLGLGYMLRAPSKIGMEELKKFTGELPPPPTTNPHDPNEEKEAIA